MTQAMPHAAPDITAATGPDVRFNGVTVRYGGQTALDAVTLEILAGQFVALVGGSGSGKTTLIKTVNRLVEPAAGDVMIDGEAVGARPVHALRREIGYVFQNIGLFPHFTVAENIAIGLWLAGGSDSAARLARAAELLELVGLPADHAVRMPDQLSGGQRQRVGVARALATRPGLMLMDEPFGALDPVTRDALGQQVRALHERLGLTTIMVTHDMAEALLLADRILVLDGGRIVADGTPSALLAGKGGAIAEALLAVPRDQAHRIAALERGA